MRLRDNVIFITDADSMSGKAIFKRLLQEGAWFILNSPSNGSNIQAELELCQANGSRYMLTNVDLCDNDQLNKLLEEAEQTMGKVDVLIHNNNVVKEISVEFGDEAIFQEILSSNAKSAFITTQAVGKQMAKYQSGKIIYVGSIHAEKPTGSSFAYSAARAAVQMLSREASLVLGRNGVQANHIMFGPVLGDDEVFKSNLSFLYEDYNYKVPNAVLGTYEDLAELVSYLASDQARYLNGADIRLDGGFLNHYLDVKTKKPNWE